MNVVKINKAGLFAMLRGGVIAAALTACTAAGPDYSPPQPDLPAQWGETAGAVNPAAAAASHRWWTLFQDTVLDSLVASAIAANLDLRIAETRIREARAQRRLTATAGMPSLDINGSYINSRRSENIPSGGSSQNLFQTDFDAGWEIDVFGGIRRQVEAADAVLAATVEDQRDVLVTLEAEVARNYFELRASQQRLAIAMENIRIQEQTVDLVRNKFQIGLGSELEAVQAETQLSLTKAEVPALESSAAQAMHQLALLLGQQPQSLKAQLAKSADLPRAPLQLPATLPSDLLRQRPDIRAAERQLAAASATVGAAVAALFPRFSLSALIGVQSVSLGDLVARGSRFWSMGPAVQWPLFDGGKAKATVEISEARRDRARITYEKTVLAALAETENALVAFDREQATHRMLAEAVLTSQRAMVIARGQYQAGITTFLNVLQSENALYQSQDKLAQSSQRLAVGLAALYKSLGGGWQAAAIGTAVSRAAIDPENTHQTRNNP